MRKLSALPPTAEIHLLNLFPHEGIIVFALMDPLSTTASVIAILTVAVNSVQFISRIVNGSNHYRDLARTVDRLHSTLKQIADVIEKNKQTDGTNDGSAWRGLRTAAYACVDDLQELQGDLLKSKRTDEKSIRGVCSTLKTALDPSKLKNADRILNLHIQQLGLQLLVLGRLADTELDMKRTHHAIVSPM